ncbi:MAG: rhomboid family intramembrane serine protease [Myxococcota bacterium]
MLATRDRWWMSQCDALLLSEGIEAHWVRLEHAMALDVPASDVERVAIALGAMGSEDRERARARQALRFASRIPLLLQTPFILGLGIAFLLFVFFILTGGTLERSDWFLDGRLERAQFNAGEWWRMVTAATLHADLEHVAGNAAFIWILGWGVAERFGEGVTALGWLLTAVAGFAVSLVFTDVQLTVGASGGLFGLLGMAAVAAYRARDRRGIGARQQLRTLGSGVLLLAFTAFSPGSNIAAHVGGFAAGAAMAAILPARAPSTGLQLVAGGLCAALVYGAWVLAGANAF